MSFFETTDEATTDIQEFNNRGLAHLKIYNIFVFFDSARFTSALNHIAFKTRMEDDKTQESRNSIRQIQMWFYNIDRDEQILEAFAGLKSQAGESKAKLSVYASESKLVLLLRRMEAADINYQNLPIILSANGLNDDLSTFLGWTTEANITLDFKTTLFFQEIAKKWIAASPVKVDFWTVHIEMHENGIIEQLIDQSYVLLKKQKVIDGFMSHLSLGYHPRLSTVYEQKRGKMESANINKFIFGVQKLKNFCCIGSPTMQSSTGIVSVNFLDDGQEKQIYKQIREYDEFQSETAWKKRSRQSKSVISIVLSNIDRFHGEKLTATTTYKTDDKKLELLLYESASSYRKVCSIAGEICLRFESEQPAELQVGENLYRLSQCKEIRVKMNKSVRMSISKDELEC